MKLNENEKKALECLAEEYGSEQNCMYFRTIAEKTKLDLKQVSRACRALRKKGLAEYMMGLFDDEGKAAGSGYCATEEGVKLLEELNNHA